MTPGTAPVGFRVLRVLATAAALAVAAPITLVGAAAFGLAWSRGWAPRRLYRAALWSLPLTLALLAGITALHGPLAVILAPAAIPLGLLAGGLAWAYRIASMTSGAGGRSPAAAIAFDQRIWRHQARAARALVAKPRAVPLTRTRDEVVAGTVIRTVGRPVTRLAGVPYSRLRSHQVVVGGTGSGKTTLMLRLWAGFIAVGSRRHAARRGAQPLLVVLDCKGGADARRVAAQARGVLREAGARSVVVWPDETSLSLWTLAPSNLVSTLVDLIEQGSGAAAYYADVLEAVVALAVQAASGPPASTADFLARLDTGWLSAAYAGRGAELALIRSASRQIGDIGLRFRTLFRRLGAGLDGPGALADADAWYCILEGTADVAVAEAQARALVDLLARFVTDHGGEHEVLLAVDEFSAVSRRLPIWQLYERARSLGLAVQVSAQSWHGLAADADERYRIASAADGGIWLLRTPHPEPLAALAGSARTIDTSRTLTGFPQWSRGGSSRLREIPVVDAAKIRSLDVGQAAYIYRGSVTYVQVKRLVASPAAVSSGAAPGSVPASGASPRDHVSAGTRTAPQRTSEPGVATRLPDIGPFLDEVFGPARVVP